MKTFNHRSTLFFPLIFVLLFSVSCSDDPVSKYYYTFTGETVASYLQNRSDKFSSFVEILTRANKLQLLSTYGEYTCFAPTNTAISNYLSTSGLSSISSLTDKDCDTIARTHLVKGAYFIANLSEGALPTANMLDRYLVLTSDSDVSNYNKLTYYINKTSKLIARDDSVTNGVVHTIDKVLSRSTDMLPGLMKKDSTISLFDSAFVATGLADTLDKYYIDANYSCGVDSFVDGIYYHTGNEYETGYYPAKRYFKYTVFTEPNAVFAANGITNLKGLTAYAKSVYDATYPEDAGLYDNDLRNRKNPLNRFVAYHILDRLGNYNSLTVTGTIKTYMQVTSAMDATDIYETMCPFTVVQCSGPSDGLFLNRKGVGSVYSVKGVRVWAPSESNADQSALNGVYHYIDDILTYSVNTREVVFNCRFRFDATTLSSDFMTSGARGRDGTATCTAFKNGSLKDWTFTPQTFVSCRNRHADFDCYQGDEVVLLGQFDFTFKLPPVPEGTYEVRLGYTALSTRGVVQVYFDNSPCGIPLDLRVGSTDPSIGWVADRETTNAGTDTDDSAADKAEDKAADKAEDKALRNRGYMKGGDSMCKYWLDHYFNFRGESQCLRRILTTRFFSSNETHYLRFKQVLDNPRAEFAFDYMELCPKSVYDSAEGEDHH